jgi:MFS family permease
MGFSYFVAPKLMEKIGPVKATVFAQTPSILVLLLVPFSSNFVVAALLLTVRSVLMNFATPIIATYTMNLVVREERALVSGITTMAWNGANALGTMLAGQFMEMYLDLPVFLCSIFYAMSIPLFYIFFKGE